MNERIKELANVAANRNIRTSPAVASDMADWAVIEKFAEAIVRECARVADASNQMKNRPVGVSVGDVIRKNFGVDN